MELSQLRAFIAVLDSGSLLNAGKALKLSRTTVQARLAALEDSLGVELLVRTNRGVQPTEFGNRFAVEARVLLRDADALVRSTARQSQEVLGQLYVRGAVGFPPQLLMILVMEITRRFPNLALRAEAASNPPVGLSPDVDVVLHFGPAVPSGAFRTFALIRFPEHLLASRRYLDTHGRPQTLEQLVEHRLMSWCPVGEDGRSLPLRDGGTLEISPYFVSNDVYVLRCLTAAGQGIALLPDAEMARGVVPGEELEEVLPDRVGRECSVWALLPEAQVATPRSRAAVRLIREMATGVFGVTPDFLVD